MVGTRFPHATAIAILSLSPLFAQAPQAILVDGAGPWRAGQWTFTVSQFSSLLSDAGYSVTTVAPGDLAAHADSPNFLLAIPSLESLPYDTYNAVIAHVSGGGSLMASGGQPFSDALYLTPGGMWLDYAAYMQAVGSPPPQGSFTTPYIATISPANQQYVDSSGLYLPVARYRGIFTQAEFRYRVIGDVLAPAATIYTNSGANYSQLQPIGGAGAQIVWLPWPQLSDPLRGQLVSALAGGAMRLSLLSGGTNQALWLPGENVNGWAVILNAGGSSVTVSIQWSIAGPAGVSQQPPISVSPSSGSTFQVPLDLGQLPTGDYTLTVRLVLGTQELDRVDSPVRVLDPASSRQPDQKIKVVNGSFMAGGQHFFPRGVNYWPRYVTGVEADQAVFSGWLDTTQYDPEIVEADLTEIAALGFNVVNIQYEGLWGSQGRQVADFLERCRSHGLWARIALLVSGESAAYTGTLAPDLDTVIQAGYLPGNDRVFAYELLWEPMVGVYYARQNLDQDWVNWVNQQYGSLDNAQQAWNLTAPVDNTGALTNPSDDQMENDGPWRIFVAAYRRFLDDYLGRNIGVFARAIRSDDPDTLLTYRDWTTMTEVYNDDTGYDIGTGVAHLDFVSPERYSPVLLWPDDRAYGLVTAYSRYQSGGKPVHWAEYGADVGGNGATPSSLAAQSAICDTMMRQVQDDGSNGASVWWWPGGESSANNGDFGIINEDGTPRASALTLAQWNQTFAVSPPDLTVAGPPQTIMVNRDSDARGSYGLFLNFQDSYVQARQAGMPVVLADQGTGTDTSTLPLVQVGDVAYAGTGPLKFANAEFAGIHVVCTTLDVTVENNSVLAVAAGAVCQMTPTLVNTGEAQWLAGSAPNRGVTLHTNAGDATLAAALPALQRTAMGPITVTMGQTGMAWSGRMQIAGVGAFGETLFLSLTPDATLTGSCAISLSATGPISAPAAGATGTIQIATGSGCGWTDYIQPPLTWVTITPASGAGNGAVAYTIAANPGTARQGTVSIAGHLFTVSQDGNAVTALTAAPLLSAASLNFGSQTVGASATAQTVNLTNAGTGALNLLGMAIGGLNSRDFAETDNCGVSLAAGAACTVQITFSPMAPGARTASLFITGNISGALPAVSLTGIGVASGPVPAIQAIVDAWGYTAGIAPGLWVTILGANLGGPPQTWNITGTQLPTTIGGVTVTVNNSPAVLLYVSATQINALVPANVAAGPATVVVQVNGVSSAPFPMTSNATHPAVYAPPSADGGTFFVTAALAGTATLVGNSATDPRVLRAAYPGDTLDLYLIGLGATLDPSAFITDRNFAGAFPVSAAVIASVGGEPSPVLFAGLTTPGLYLVRIVVPSDLTAGAQALQVSAGGMATRPDLMLQIANPSQQ